MSGQRILFVDRDGTIIEEPSDFQVDAFEKVRFVEGVIPAMLKLRDAGIRASSSEAAGVTVRPDKYADLVTRVYRDEKFPKPRNVIGLPKSISVNEMEKLIIANAEIDDEDLIALGNQRAQNTKNWLQEKGQVAPDRMFIVAPKLGKSDNNANGSRVEFALK